MWSFEVRRSHVLCLKGALPSSSAVACQLRLSTLTRHSAGKVHGSGSVEQQHTGFVIREDR
eukprot:8002229-Alexandrium_andersonii.AAC.1